MTAFGAVADQPLLFSISSIRMATAGWEADVQNDPMGPRSVHGTVNCRLLFDDLRKKKGCESIGAVCPTRYRLNPPCIILCDL